MSNTSDTKELGFAIVNDAIYEGSERLGLVIEADPRRVCSMAST